MTFNYTFLLPLQERIYVVKMVDFFLVKNKATDEVFFIHIYLNLYLSSEHAFLALTLSAYIQFLYFCTLAKSEILLQL